MENSFSKMYETYLSEREGLEVIRSEKGFIAYQMDYTKRACLINDYFILDAYRRSGEGYRLADIVFTICKERGIEKVYCQSDIKAKGHRVAALSILNYGFDVFQTQGDLIFYSMELSK